MTDLKTLTAAQVKKLPCGAKVVIKGKRKDKVCTVTQEGKHKKLYYSDPFRGMEQRIRITDDMEYERYDNRAKDKETSKRAGFFAR